MEKYLLEVHVKITFENSAGIENEAIKNIH